MDFVLCIGVYEEIKFLRNTALPVIMGLVPQNQSYYFQCEKANDKKY